jgi:hypothetical protein
MRNSTAYFAGVATVFTATALGFGGALIVTNATAPRSPAEPTKLERSIAAPAQAATTLVAKSVAASDATTSQDTSQTPAPAAAQPQQSAQQSAPSTSQPQSTALEPTPAQPAANEANQSQAASELQSPANAYARGSDADIRKYVRKRDRRWARRHYRDEDTPVAKASDPTDQSTSQTSSANPSVQSGQAESMQPQIKSADQTSAKVDEADTVKGKRKRERRWARGYARDDGVRGDDRDQAVEVRETPRDEAPSFFAPRRWRPFFSGDDDD